MAPPVGMHWSRSPISAADEPLICAVCRARWRAIAVAVLLGLRCAHAARPGVPRLSRMAAGLRAGAECRRARPAGAAAWCTVQVPGVVAAGGAFAGAHGATDAGVRPDADLVPIPLRAETAPRARLQSGGGNSPPRSGQDDRASRAARNDCRRRRGNADPDAPHARSADGPIWRTHSPRATMPPARHPGRRCVHHRRHIMFGGGGTARSGAERVGGGDICAGRAAAGDAASI